MAAQGNDGSSGPVKIYLYENLYKAPKHQVRGSSGSKWAEKPTAVPIDSRQGIASPPFSATSPAFSPRVISPLPTQPAHAVSTSVQSSDGFIYPSNSPPLARPDEHGFYASSTSPFSPDTSGQNVTRWRKSTIAAPDAPGTNDLRNRWHSTASTLLNDGVGATSEMAVNDAQVPASVAQGWQKSEPNNPAKASAKNPFNTIEENGWSAQTISSIPHKAVASSATSTSRYEIISKSSSHAPASSPTAAEVAHATAVATEDDPWAAWSVEQAQVKGEDMYARRLAAARAGIVGAPARQDISAPIQSITSSRPKSRMQEAPRRPVEIATPDPSPSTPVSLPGSNAVATSAALPGTSTNDDGWGSWNASGSGIQGEEAFAQRAALARGGRDTQQASTAETKKSFNVKSPAYVEPVTAAISPSAHGAAANTAQEAEDPWASYQPSGLTGAEARAARERLGKGGVGVGKTSKHFGATSSSPTEEQLKKPSAKAELQSTSKLARAIDKAHLGSSSRFGQSNVENPSVSPKSSPSITALPPVSGWIPTDASPIEPSNVPATSPPSNIARGIASSAPVREPTLLVDFLSHDAAEPSQSSASSSVGGETVRASSPVGLGFMQDLADLRFEHPVNAAKQEVASADATVKPVELFSPSSTSVPLVETPEAPDSDLALPSPGVSSPRSFHSAQPGLLDEDIPDFSFSDSPIMSTAPQSPITPKFSSSNTSPIISTENTVIRSPLQPVMASPLPKNIPLPASRAPPMTSTPATTIEKERQALLAAVKLLDPAFEKAEEMTDMLISLPKKERAMCRFSAAYLARKISEAREILEMED